MPGLSRRALFAALLFPSTVLLAQTASTNVPGASETNSVARLPVITVAAQKEPALSQAIPVSVTPVTQETIQKDDISEVKDAELYAPNVFINEFTARKLSNPYFRGIGSSPNNPGVTTYIDGVPQLNANSSNIELVDEDQIEFVRGPQGALFGRNTVGGLININSLRPSLNAWRGGVQTEYGNYNYTDTRLEVSGPITKDQTALSLAGGYSSREGYTKNDFTSHSLDSREGGFGKGQFLWTPSQDWEARLILSGEHDEDGDYALGDLNAIRANPHHVSHDFEGFTHRDIVAPTLLLNHYGTAVDFAMTSGLVWWKTEDKTDLDYTPLPLVTRDNAERDVQVTEEVRFASAKDAPIELSDDLKLKWQGGLFFFNQNYDQNAVNSYGPGALPGVLFPADQRSTAHLDDIGVGVFGQSTLTAFEKLDLSVGLRGDYENKDADLGSAFTPLIAPSSSFDRSRDFTEVTPQFGLAYHLTPEKLVYAAVSRGYKAGGFNAASPLGKETFDAEHSWNYELGTKTAWLDNRLSANLALFYIDWDDLQLNQPTGSPGQYFIGNAGAADSKGVEFELNARPLAGWDIFAGVGFTDARFLSGATAAHTSALGVDSTVDVADRHLIYTPDYTANGGMEYDWQACKQTTLYARGELVAYGSYFYNPANTASQTAYTLANFRAGVRGSHWFAEGWVKNAFDTHYVPIAFEFPNGQLGGSGFVGESGAPVTFGLRAGLMF